MTPASPSRASTADDPATRLCTSCGLCCVGAIHGHVVLRPDEVERAREVGLSVETEPAPRFKQPCPMFVDHLCTIYRERPRACRGYRCQLLLDLDAGRTELEPALAKVAKARQLQDAHERDRAAPATDAAGAARQRLRLIELRFYLDKHFVNANDGRLIKDSLVERPEPSQ